MKASGYDITDSTAYPRCFGCPVEDIDMLVRPRLHVIGEPVNDL